MQGEDVAHLWMAGVGAVTAGRVGDHLHHPLLDLLWRGGDLDVIIQ